MRRRRREVRKEARAVDVVACAPVAGRRDDRQTTRRHLGKLRLCACQLGGVGGRLGLPEAQAPHERRRQIVGDVGCPVQQPLVEAVAPVCQWHARAHRRHHLHVHRVLGVGVRRVVVAAHRHIGRRLAVQLREQRRVLWVKGAAKLEHRHRSVPRRRGTDAGLIITAVARAAHCRRGNVVQLTQLCGRRPWRRHDWVAVLERRAPAPATEDGHDAQAVGTRIVDKPGHLPAQLAHRVAARPRRSAARVTCAARARRQLLAALRERERKVVDGGRPAAAAAAAAAGALPRERRVEHAAARRDDRREVEEGERARRRGRGRSRLHERRRGRGTAMSAAWLQEVVEATHELNVWRDVGGNCGRARGANDGMRHGWVTERSQLRLAEKPRSVGCR